jgi:hypothetical protein
MQMPHVSVPELGDPVPASWLLSADAGRWFTTGIHQPDNYRGSESHLAEAGGGRLPRTDVVASPKTLDAPPTLLLPPTVLLGPTVLLPPTVWHPPIVTVQRERTPERPPGQRGAELQKPSPKIRRR